MIDVGNEDWPVKVSIPAIMDLREIKQTQICISSSYFAPLAIPTVELRYLVVFNEDGKCLGTLSNILINKWNNGEIKNDLGNNSLKLIKIYVRDDKDSYPCDITIKYTVSQKIYLGQIGVLELKGFFKNNDKNVVTKRLVTEEIDFNEIEENWTQLNSLKDVEQPPTVYMVVLGECEDKY
jgi:hypothetical protein